MPAARKRRAGAQAGLFLAAAVLVFLVALGSNRHVVSNILVERTFDRDLAITLLFVVLVACCLVAFGALAYLLLGTMRGPRRDPVRPSSLPQPWWVKVVALAFALACLAGGVLALLYARGEPVTPAAPLVPPVSPGDGGAAGDGADPYVVRWWVVAVVLVVVLAALAVFFYVAHRQRRFDEGPSPERAQLRAAVEASLDDVQQAGDCREAVIRAYATMEKVLAGHGLARREAEAPFEYLARWTAALAIGRPIAERLTTLYEWARFSSHSVDDHMRDEALGALRALRQELGGKPR